MNKKILLVVLFILCGVIIGTIVYITMGNNINKVQKEQSMNQKVNTSNKNSNTNSAQPSTTNDNNNAPAATNTTPSDKDLDTLFDVANKAENTKVYYSEKLGVGFTYNPEPAKNTTVTVTEKNNTIYVHTSEQKPEEGQYIEVFTKDAQDTFTQALEKEFLTDYDSADCFVKLYDTNEQELSDYQSAGISYPPTTNENAPAWENGEKCPQPYTETNGISYFLINPDVPTTYIFASIGQYSITSDGNTKTASEAVNWSHSIRIIE